MKAGINLGKINRVLGNTSIKVAGLYVIGGIVGVLLIRWGIRKIFKRDSEADSMRKELAGLYEKSFFEKILGSGGGGDILNGGLTISKEDEILITQNLLNAMNKVGTDENTIIRNLEQLQTKGDLLLIIKAFGIKCYDGWGLADTYLSKKFFCTDKNLTGWLQSELSAINLSRVRKIYENLGVSF